METHFITYSFWVKPASRRVRSSQQHTLFPVELLPNRPPPGVALSTGQTLAHAHSAEPGWPIPEERMALQRAVIFWWSRNTLILWILSNFVSGFFPNLVILTPIHDFILWPQIILSKEMWSGPCYLLNQATAFRREILTFAALTFQ